MTRRSGYARITATGAAAALAAVLAVAVVAVLAATLAGCQHRPPDNRTPHQVQAGCTDVGRGEVC